MVIREAYNREASREGVQHEMEKFGRAFCPLHSIRDPEGRCPVFPFTYIVDQLERIAFEHAQQEYEPLNLDSMGWVVDTLHARVRIPHIALFARYKTLLEEPQWQPGA